MKFTSVFVFVGVLAVGCGQKYDQRLVPVSRAPRQSAATSIPAYVLTPDVAAQRSKQISNIQYTLSLSLNSSANFMGVQKINFEFHPQTQNKNEETFLEFSGGSIQSLQVNGTAFTLNGVYDGELIKLRASQLKTGPNQITIQFSHPYVHDGLGLHEFKDPTDQNTYLYSQSETYFAHRIYPCFDQPDLKAYFDITVEAPANWQVITATRESKVTDVPKQPRKLWTFQRTPFMTTYALAIVAGPYAVQAQDVNGIPVRIFVRQSMSKYLTTADRDEWFKLLGQGIQFYSKEFSTPYPFGKLDQIAVPDFRFGAMENIGAVTFAEDDVLFQSPKAPLDYAVRANVILHELSHMWFGNLVTMKWWNDLWLNESFAEFVSHLVMYEATDYKDQAWIDFYSRKARAYITDQSVITHPIVPKSTTTEDAIANVDSITYSKGASALKQLRFLLGADKFNQGLADYFRTNAFKNTTLSDFIGTLSKASGVNLSDWEKSWLETTGANTVQANWSCDAKESKITAFSLKQTPSQPNSILRSHKTRIGFYGWNQDTKSLEQTSFLDANYSGAETKIDAAAGLPCPIFVFPNQDDYDYVKVSLDSASLLTIQHHLSDLKDSFTRQMLWDTLWSMVLDGNLKPSEYKVVALTNLSREQNSSVISGVISTLVSPSSGARTVERYLAGADRAAFLDRVESYFKSQLDSAEAGSPQQLIWFKALLRSAHSKEILSFLEDLLDGKASIPKFKLTQEYRWSTLAPLARNLRSGAMERLQAELKKDPSDTGKKLYYSIEASIPDASIKAKWLSVMIGGSKTQAGLSADDLLQAMAGFHIIGEEDLSRQTAETYFATLANPKVFDDEMLAAQFSSMMYPAVCDPQIVTKAKAFVNAHPKLAVGVKRGVLAAITEDERCIAIRAEP